MRDTDSVESPAQSSGQQLLQQFEESHGTLNKELRLFNDSTQSPKPSHELQAMIQRLTEWELYFKRTLPAAQQLNRDGHPDLLQRLTALQQEIEQIIGIYEQSLAGQKKHEATLSAIVAESNRATLDTMRDIHDRTTAFYNKLNHPERKKS